MSTNMVVKKSSSIVDLFLAGLQQQDPEHYEKLSEQGRKVAMVFQKKQSHQHGRDPSMIALELLDPERYKILSEQGRQLAMLFQRKKSHQLSHDKDHLYGMRQKPFKTELTVDPTLYNIIFFLAYMLKYIQKQYVEPSEKFTKLCSLGGIKGAQTKRKESQKDTYEWQIAMNDAFKKNPRLSHRDLSNQIARQFNVNEHTVRKKTIHPKKLDQVPLLDPLLPLN